MLNTDPPTIAGQSRTRRAKAAQFIRENGFLGALAKIRQAGPRAIVEFIVRNIRFTIYLFLSHVWDRRHDVDTGGQVEIEDVEVVGPNKKFGHPIVSTSPRTFGYFARYFPVDRREFTFVDMGSGKGRAVILAAKYGFKRAIGVEFSKSAHLTAQHNVENFQRKYPVNCDISLVLGDVTDYNLPLDRLVLYFANPFALDLWPIMLGNVVESYQSRPREFYLILTGSQPIKIQTIAPLISTCGIFEPIGRGVAPFYLDTYLPFHYEAFKTR